MSNFDSFALGGSEQRVGVLSLALLTNVTNSGDLLAQAKRGQLDAALIAVERVCSVFPVLCAATRVMANVATGSLRTNAWSSELLYLLSCNSNVSVAFSRFGIQASSRAVLLAFAHSDATRIESVLSLVRGDRVPLAQLASLADVARVREHYAIADAELSVDELESALESAVCNRVALFAMKNQADT
jgi:hypothetical protein